MDSSFLHVVQVGFYVDPRAREPAQLLEDWPTLVDVAEAARQGGLRVSVVQACHRAEVLHRNGVSYHFLAGVADTPALIANLDPDVIHVHGLCFPREVLRLAAHLPTVPILLQDHASRPPRWWRRSAWGRCGRAVAGVAFCSRQQAQPFIEAGVLEPDTAVYEIPESTSRFQPGDAAAARAAARVSGEPLLLWVGHLDPNKDPLTVLEGVALAARVLPGLELWCCFGNTELLRRMRRRIRSDPLLESRTHLLGRVSHSRVEQLMRAADAYVSGSHREGSGYALIEALACGLAPVVTNIPSFRALTGAGAVGQLWQPGDPASLCSALLAMARGRGAQTRAAVRAHFERELSHEALGRKLVAAYEDLLRRSAPPASEPHLMPRRRGAA